MKYVRAYLLTICFVALSPLLLGAEKIHLVAEWTSEIAHPDEINLEAVNEDGSAYEQFIFVISSSQAIRNPKLFRLTLAKGGKLETIEIASVKPRSGKGAPADRAERVSLILAKPPVDKGKYTLTLPAGALVFDLPSGVTLADVDKPIEITGDVEEHNKYAHPFPENKLSLQQGDETGTVSFQYYHNYFFGTARNADLHLGLTADASLRSALSNKYIDKLEAEAGGYLVKMVGEEHEVLGQRGIIEYGFSTKLQADQQFEKIDSTVGLNSWLWLNNAFFGNIYRNACFFGDKPDFGLPPTLIFGYDYVSHLKNDASAHGFSGNNRLTGRFAWTLPIGRNIHTDILILSQIKEISLVMDISGTYDVDQSKVAPLANLSLDFALSTSDKMPNVSLSFADGKAAPKFQQFDAFLAGFKMHF